MSEELDLNDVEVLANLPGKNIYGVEVGNMVNAIEKAAEDLASLRSALARRTEERDSYLDAVHLAEAALADREKKIAEKEQRIILLEGFDRQTVSLSINFIPASKDGVA